MTRDDIFKFFFVFLFALGIGLLSIIFTTTPIIQPAPTPANGPFMDHPDRDLVIGMSEVLVEVHREAVATRTELEAVKIEARQIISAMVAEIQRLQKRPTLAPGNTVTDST